MTPGWTASGGGRMVLHVRLLAEPSLWCWEIRDEGSAALIEGSWANWWTAYPSMDLARAAAEARLAVRSGAGHWRVRRAAQGRRLASNDHDRRNRDEVPTMRGAAQ